MPRRIYDYSNRGATGLLDLIKEYSGSSGATGGTSSQRDHPVGYANGRDLKIEKMKYQYYDIYFNLEEWEEEEEY